MITFLKKQKDSRKLNNVLMWVMENNILKKDMQEASHIFSLNY